VLQVGTEEERFLCLLNRELRLTTLLEKLICFEDMEVQIVRDAISTHGVVPDPQ
jgi:hypothetical protein